MKYELTATRTEVAVNSSGLLMNADPILRQRAWSEQELIDAGLRYFQRRRQVVLARE